MYRNENGNWIGEDGYVFVREDKAAADLNKALVVGFLGGVFVSVLALFVWFGGV